MTYVPEQWLETLTQILENYTKDTLNAPNLWDVRMEFPGAAVDAEKLPLKKTIIHFEIDAIEERPLGMGDTPMEWNYTDTTVYPTLNRPVLWFYDGVGAIYVQFIEGYYGILPPGAARLSATYGDTVDFSLSSPNAQVSTAEIHNVFALEPGEPITAEFSYADNTVTETRVFTAGVAESDLISHQVQPQWAHIHIINFDIGIWASDRSGGTTSRMRARQHLTRLFGSPEGVQRLQVYSNGGDGVIEILDFTGGRFIQDRSNDVRLYRMVDGNLVVRVFSRTPIEDSLPSPAITEILQAPNLTILG